MHDQSTTKRCSKCGEDKPLDDFSRCKSGLYGRYSICKPCKSAKSTAWVKQNREKRNETRSARRERRKAEGPDVVVAEKRCRDCGETKPRERFGKDRGARDGLQPRCKACARERARERRAKNREREPVSIGTKVCAQCRRERGVEDFSIHRTQPDGRASYCRECYSEMRDTDEYRERTVATVNRSRARRHGAAGDATAEQRRARWDYYGGRCWMCGCEAEGMDHVIALSNGGGNWPANLRPACASCNASKFNHDWRPLVAAAS